MTIYTPSATIEGRSFLKINKKVVPAVDISSIPEPISTAEIEIEQDPLGSPITYTIGDDIFTTDFFYTPTYVDVEFTATATLPGDRVAVDYYWDFGDGTTGWGNPIVHNYEAPMPFTHLVLRATDDSGDRHFVRKQLYFSKGSIRYSILRTDPALYWPLNSSTGAEDSSGNNRDGTGQGGITVGGSSLAPSGLNDSTDFDGSDDYISSTYNPFTNGTTRTFAGWAYRDDSDDADTLVASDNATGRFYIRLGSGSNDVQFNSDDAGGAQTFSAAWPGNAQWVHWAVVFNEATNNVELFINGASVGTVTETSAYGGSVGNFKVGATATSSNPFDGKIAHVGVWERALTAEEIAAIYEAR